MHAGALSDGVTIGLYNLFKATIQTIPGATALQAKQNSSFNQVKDQVALNKQPHDY